MRPIIISKADFETLLREGRSFEDYFRYKEEKSLEETEKSVLEDVSAEEPDNPPSQENPDSRENVELEE